MWQSHKNGLLFVYSEFRKYPHFFSHRGGSYLLWAHFNVLWNKHPLGAIFSLFASSTNIWFLVQDNLEFFIPCTTFLSSLEWGGEERGKILKRTNNPSARAHTHKHIYIYIYIYMFVCVCFIIYLYYIPNFIWKRKII